MNKKRILIGAAVITGALIFAAYFWLRGAQIVDFKPPIEAADSYFSTLKQGHADLALASYSSEFRAKYGVKWLQLLSGLQDRFGVVTSADLKESSIVPMSGVGCTLLIYDVRRGSFSTVENLIFCPDKSAGPLIVGHQQTRLDTGQQVAAGATVHRVGVHAP